MIRELKQKRAKLWEDMQALSAKAKDEKRSLTDEESAKWDEMNKDMVSLRKEVERLETEAEIAKDFAEKRDQAIKQEPKKALNVEKVFERYMRHGAGSLGAEERNLLHKRGTATQVSDSTGALGEYLVPDTWAASIVETMKQYGGMMGVCRVINTSQGGVFHVPTIDDTSTSAGKFAQDAAVTIQDLTFSEVTISDYIYATTVLASYAMLQDSAYDLPGFINEQLGIRLGRKANYELTLGDGTGDINGVVTATSAGKTAAAVNAITRDEIVDLVHSVDRAYRASGTCRFMLNDSVLAYIKKLAIGSADDRPLWQPSIRVGEPDTLEGYPITVNNDMASTIEASAVTMLFGDFSKYYIKQVGSVGMQRLNERYADKLVVGFLGWLRLGGNLVDTSAIKQLVQAAS